MVCSRLQLRGVWLIVALAVAILGGGDRTAFGAMRSMAAKSAGWQLRAESSGCRAVRFTVRSGQVTPLLFAGTVSGDISGTVELTFAPPPFKFAGVTIANSGTGHWQVSSDFWPGVVTFETSFKNRNINTDRPGSSAVVFENIGEHRGTDGVERANFSYIGSIDVTILEAVHDYHGVICL